MQWARAGRRLGASAAVVATLTELAGEFPLAEPIAAALVTALHTAGRTAEADQRYAEVRRRLADELGTEPGAELRAAYEARLDAAPAARAGAVPAQLPMDARGFVARDDELAQLDAALADGRERPRAVVITAVLGMAGVGKTALAVHWAHRVASRFPDGQLYVNLRGFDAGGTAMDPADALHGFLTALRVPPARIPLDLEARVGLFRSALTGRRVLVLLDNARDADQVRPLLPGDPGCVAVVTSRNRLGGLIAGQGARAIALDLLSPAAAGGLLARRIGAARTAAEPGAVADIVAACARLPLALAIVAARAATRPGVPLAGLVEELRAARGGLDGFTGDDELTDVRAVFSWSYRTLSEGAAGLFRQLGVHPGPEAGAGAMPSLAGRPAGEVRPLLAELTHAHLVSERRPGRYACHDLLRAYAVELAGARDPAEDRRATTMRLVDHYTHTAYEAARLLNAHREQVPPAPPVPGVTPERPADPGAALNWFTVEHQTLLAIVRLAAGAGCDLRTGQLAAALWDFFDRRGHWRDWADTHQAAVSAARRLGDRPGEAVAHRGLGRAYARMGRYDDASQHYREALALFGELADPAGQAFVHMSLGAVAELRGDAPGRLRHVERALELFRAAGHRAGEARALNSIGWHHALAGAHELALTHCEQALAVQIELGDRRGAAATWDSLGYAQYRFGQHDRAVASFLSSLELVRQLGDRGVEGAVLTHLGEVHQARGEQAAAHQWWREALVILEELGDPGAERVRSWLSPAAAAAPGAATG